MTMHFVETIYKYLIDLINSIGGLANFAIFWEWIWNPIKFIIWDNAEKIGAIGTFGAFIYMIKANKQQREQWLNDAFVKEEAKMWIEYRTQFYELTYSFTSLINCIKQDFGMASSQDIKLEFKEITSQINALRKLHKSMKPYIKNYKKINWESTRKLLFEIMAFYSDVQQTNIKQHITEEDGEKEYNIESAELKKLTGWFIIRANLKYKEELNLLKDKPQKYKLEKAIELFKQEIEQINEALNEKVTAHLKK